MHSVCCTATVLLGSDKRFWVRFERTGHGGHSMHGPIDCPDVAHRLADELVAWFSRSVMLWAGTAMGRVVALPSHVRRATGDSVA